MALRGDHDFILDGGRMHNCPSEMRSHLSPYFPTSRHDSSINPFSTASLESPEFKATDPVDSLLDSVIHSTSK